MQKSKTEKLLFRYFCRFNSCEGLFEMKNYPAKKIRVLYNICVRAIFFIHSVSNICSNVANFPAKRLRKNTAPKIRMRQFFKKNITNKVDIYWRVVFLYSHLLLLNKEID